MKLVANVTTGMSKQLEENSNSVIGYIFECDSRDFTILFLENTW